MSSDVPVQSNRSTPKYCAMRPVRPSVRRWSALVAIVLCVGPWQAASFGWGRLGHRVSAKLAEARLTPAVQTAVRDLLEPGESLADASTWADEQRETMPATAPWHYVNVPITTPRYDAEFCPEQGCVVSKIEEFRKILADKSAPRPERQKALRFLVHLVQDLHQPLHVGDRGDRGGNDLQVQFFGEGTNLHQVWDSGLIEQAGRDEAQWVHDLTILAAPERASHWERGTVVEWANESLMEARRVYRIPGTLRLMEAGTKLGQSYEDYGLPVARHRLAQSGVRLAMLLNEALRQGTGRE
jgi:nuclease S1